VRWPESVPHKVFTKRKGAVLMQHRILRLCVLGEFALAIGLCGIPATAMAASLEEILIKKGIITQEDLQQIKAEEAAENAKKEQRIQAEVEQKVDAKVAEKVESDFPVKASWGKKGFHLETRDGNWATNLQWRAQMRYTYPYRSDPRTLSQFDADEKSNFELRRVRMKITGHA